MSGCFYFLFLIFPLEIILYIYNEYSISGRAGFGWESQQTELFFRLSSIRFLSLFPEPGCRGREAWTHIASSSQDNTERQTTIQAHNHTYSQFRVTISSLSQIHVFGWRTQREPTLAGGEDVNAAGPYGFKSGTFLR